MSNSRLALKKQKALLLAEGDLLRHVARKELDGIRSVSWRLNLAASALLIGVKAWRTLAEHRKPDNS